MAFQYKILRLAEYGTGANGFINIGSKMKTYTIGRISTNDILGFLTHADSLNAQRYYVEIQRVIGENVEILPVAVCKKVNKKHWARVNHITSITGV